MATQTHNADFYNETYRRPNYFRYWTWLYEPYVAGLIDYCGLKKGASVLDAGCGQGFFSHLFSRHNMKVYGADISEAGIRMAETQYGSVHLRFAVADVQTAVFSEQFDCVFVRSCSLYNTDAFPLQNDVTDNLLKHLKPGGVFIFAYNSNFSSKLSPKWRYHSLEAIQRHFNKYPNSEIFFLNKLTTYLLRQYSLSHTVTHLNILLSKLSGVGGDLVCILRKPVSFPSADPETGDAEGKSGQRESKGAPELVSPLSSDETNRMEISGEPLGGSLGRQGR